MLKIWKAFSLIRRMITLNFKREYFFHPLVVRIDLATSHNHFTIEWFHKNSQTKYKCQVKQLIYRSSKMKQRINLILLLGANFNYRRTKSSNLSMIKKMCWRNIKMRIWLNGLWLKIEVEKSRAHSLKGLTRLGNTWVELKLIMKAWATSAKLREATGDT